MKVEKYQLSFTTGGLYLPESQQLAELFLDLNDWNLTCEKVKSNNLLQARTKTSSKRICREIVSRLKMLTAVETELLVNGNAQDQRYLLWFAICRKYKFIGEFSIEVLREHYISLNTFIDYEDFNCFFNQKAEWHVELEDIRPTTKNKLRQVLFKIMREAELLTSDGAINPAMPSYSLLEAVTTRDLAFLPILESDLKGICS